MIQVPILLNNTCDIFGKKIFKPNVNLKEKINFTVRVCIMCDL